jgi:hypothetical protein
LNVCGDDDDGGDDGGGDDGGDDDEEDDIHVGEGDKRDICFQLDGKEGVTVRKLEGKDNDSDMDLLAPDIIL